MSTCDASPSRPFPLPRQGSLLRKAEALATNYLFTISPDGFMTAPAACHVCDVVSVQVALPLLCLWQLRKRACFAMSLQRIRQTDVAYQSGHGGVEFCFKKNNRGKERKDKKWYTIPFYFRILINLFSSVNVLRCFTLILELSCSFGFLLSVPKM